MSNMMCVFLLSYLGIGYKFSLLYAIQAGELCKMRMCNEWLL